MKNFLNKDRRKKNPDLRITVGRPKEHHGLEIVETYQEVDKMTPEQVETHKETISRILFTNELKLHHKLSWDEAMKHGCNNQSVEELDRSRQEISHINAKIRKSVHNHYS